jgi:hypothetical protein
MKTEKTKDNGTKERCADFGCCDPENFKKMFEMMNKCCPGQSNSTDLSAMMSGMMKNMMEMCCGSKTEDIKVDIKPQKEPEEKGCGS